MSLIDKHKKAKDKSDQEKKKDEDTKTFGYKGFLKFTFPRLWNGSFYKKFLVIFNFICVLIPKLCQVTVPLILGKAVDAIICDRSQELNDCPSEHETYVLIIIYAMTRFAGDTIKYIREIPYANMAAAAEISIAHDVYDHIQR